MADPRATLDGLFGAGGYKITSGYRSPADNQRVGGAPNSDHLRGEAFDIVVPGMNTAQVSAKLRGAGGYLKDEGDHVHWSYDRGQPQGASMQHAADSADIFADEAPPPQAQPRVIGRGKGITVELEPPASTGGQPPHAADSADIFADDPPPEPMPGMAQEPSAPPQIGRDGWSQATGLLQNVANSSLPGYDEAQAGVGAAIDLGGDFLTGKRHLDPKDLPGSLDDAWGDAWRKQRDRQNTFAGGYKAQHPHTGALASGVGMAAGAAVPFGLGADLARGGSMAMRAARGATSAAADGYAYGFGDKGDLSERLSGGATAATIAAPFGGAVGAASRGSRIVQDVRAAADQVRNYLDQWGVRHIAPEMEDSITQLVRQGHRPEAAARMVMASELPVPVPLTAGQVSGDVTQQVAEQAMHRGAKGQDAANIMGGQRATQRDALRGNVQAIGEQVGGGRAPQAGEAGARASTSLNELYDASRANTDALFDAARDQGRGVRLPEAEVPHLAGAAREAIAEFVPESIPNVRAALGRLDQTGPSTELRDVYGVRQMLTNLRSSGGPESAAAGRAVRALDGYMDDALSRDLFSGDPAAVQRWRDALAARRTQAVRFEDNDLVQRLTEPMPNAATRRLAVQPEDASNYIFGRDALGWVGKKGLVRDLGRLRDTLGRDSGEWQAIRAEAFQRFGRQGEGAYEGTERGFSGVKFTKAWGDFERGNPELASLLFTPQERSTIRQFAQVSLHATSPVTGAVNTSNTATVAAQLLNKLSFLRGTPGISEMIKAQERSAGAAAATRAARGAPPPIPQRTRAQGLLPGPSRVIGAGASSERPR